MHRNRAFGVASWIALLASAITALGALATAAGGVAGLSGWSDYPARISLVPGTGLLDVTYQPSWGARAVTEVCDRIDLQAPRSDCESIVLEHTEGQRLDGHVVLPSDVRPVSADLDGRLLLDADPGWNPLIASLYGMSVLGLLVVAFLLWQLGLLLRAASHDAPFSDHVVRRLRILGITLIGWEVLEPVLWLFLSPKAWDYHLVGYAQGVGLQLTDMEPGGPQFVLIAFGALLLLLAEIFRRGVSLEQDQRLTV